MTRGGRWEDPYTRRARDERWPARSVYKLQEIDSKFKLLRRGSRVLDLGCYPGSWSQYSVRQVGPRGDVVGVDLRGPERLSSSNFRFIEADVLELDPQWLKKKIGSRDAVICDLAPKTTGIRIADTCRSMELALCALDIALTILNKGGYFLCKVFEGEDFKDFKLRLERCFDQVKVIRPSAVRKGSREVYLLCLNVFTRR
jgi:23S rRNA (uridine2552-2'-O)-methyltransferase